MWSCASQASELVAGAEVWRAVHCERNCLQKRGCYSGRKALARLAHVLHRRRVVVVVVVVFRSASVLVDASDSP